jgi:hypothetical protein
MNTTIWYIVLLSIYVIFGIAYGIYFIKVKKGRKLSILDDTLHTIATSSAGISETVTIICLAFGWCLLCGILGIFCPIVFNHQKKKN